MIREDLTYIKEPFTPHDLLRLAETVQSIDCKSFTLAMAETLRRINSPPLIMEQRLNMNINEPTDEVTK